MMPPRKDNTNGVRFLHKGPTGYAFAVKLEVGCKYGQHGKTRNIYIGNDKDTAIKAANEINGLLQSGVSREEIYSTLRRKYRYTL